MIGELITYFKLLWNPPKTGDVFEGDPLEFILGNVMEHILHGTKNKFGDTQWYPIPSKGCYRLTIESDAMSSYYRCSSEVLCTHESGDQKEWKKRSQPRRILKTKFHDMIVEGRLKKYGLS